MRRAYGIPEPRRSQESLRFTGVDGEGTGNGTNHRYVLLGVGSEQISDSNGLSFMTIVEFLYERFLTDPKAVYAGYFLGYDFAQWLRSLPENRARMLLTERGRMQRARTRSQRNKVPFPVKYQGWDFDMLAMKRMKLKPEGASAWMYINDAGPFFQTSLLKAINPAVWEDPILTQEEYNILRKGKESRSHAVLGSEMQKYNSLENEIFSRLMSRTSDGFLRTGIKLKRNQWYGPGQAAQTWLNKIKLPNAEVLAKVPGLPEMLNIGRMTYYGGWFEIFAHGPIPGMVSEYDINSAYPFIASRLPCLLHGKWRRDTDISGSGEYTIVHGRVRGSDPHIGAMLHRLPDGNIRRPHATGGYYWLHELRAAERAGLIDEIQASEAWHYTPCACRPPLRGLVGLYDERLRVGKNTPLGKGAKLIYNSVYGKLAQSVGDPKYANALYASLITAGCRTMILDAIATHPRKADAVVMVATDGVYFTEPHPGLPVSDKIGEWDVQEKQNLCLFKPGVYWDDDARNRIAHTGTASFKARGVDAQAFSSKIAEIDAHYRQWPDGYPAERDPVGSRAGWHPEVTFDTTFSMVTPGQALQWNRWEKCGTLGHSDPHPSGCQGCNGSHLVQDADPIGKRHSGYYDPVRRIFWSRPYPDGGNEFDIESTPYDKRFGQPDPDQYGWTDDGKVVEGFAWLLHD